MDLDVTADTDIPSNLDECSYRFLQKLAKVHGLPANSKKVLLVKMLYLKKNQSPKSLSTLVARIKQKNKQARRLLERRKQRQDSETSLSSSSSTFFVRNRRPARYTSPLKTCVQIVRNAIALASSARLREYPCRTKKIMQCKQKELLKNKNNLQRSQFMGRRSLAVTAPIPQQSQFMGRRRVAVTAQISQQSRFMGRRSVAVTAQISQQYQFMGRRSVAVTAQIPQQSQFMGRWSDMVTAQIPQQSQFMGCGSFAVTASIPQKSQFIGRRSVAFKAPIPQQSQFMGCGSFAVTASILQKPQFMDRRRDAVTAPIPQQSQFMGCGSFAVTASIPQKSQFMGRGNDAISVSVTADDTEDELGRVADYISRDFDLPQDWQHIFPTRSAGSLYTEPYTSSDTCFICKMPASYHQCLETSQFNRPRDSIGFGESYSDTATAVVEGKDIIRGEDLPLSPQSDATVVLEIDSSVEDALDIIGQDGI